MTRDWKTVALWFALLLNLGLAGYLVVQTTRPAPPVRQVVSMRSGGAPLFDLATLNALTPLEKSELRQSIRASLPDIRERRLTAEEAQARFQESFRQDPFDATASIKLLQAVSKARADQYETAIAVYIRMFDSLPSDAKAEAIARHDTRSPQARSLHDGG